MASSYRSAAKKRILRKLDEINELKTNIYTNIELVTNTVTREAQEFLLIKDATLFKAHFAQANADLESCIIKLTNVYTGLQSQDDEVNTGEDDDSGSDNESLAVSMLSDSVCSKPTRPPSALPVSMPRAPMASTSWNACVDPGAEHKLVQLSEALEPVPCPTVSDAAEDMCDIPELEVHVGQSLICLVTHVASPALFYLQRVFCKELDELVDILGSLDSVVMLSGNRCHYVRPGMTCCAFDIDMNVWQRAVITEVHETADEVSVFYVDNGESQKVSVANLRQLDYRIRYIQRQAIPCSLNCSTSSDDRNRPLIGNPVTGSVVKAVLVSAVGPTKIVDLFEIDQMIAESSKQISSSESSFSNGSQLRFKDQHVEANSKAVEGKNQDGRRASSDIAEDKQKTFDERRHDLSADIASSKIRFQLKMSKRNGGLVETRPPCFEEDDEIDSAVPQNEKPLPDVDGLTPLHESLYLPAVGLYIFDLPTLQIPLDESSKKNDERNKFTAYVSAVIDSFDFYVHPLSRETAEVDALREAMGLRYANSLPLLVVEPEGYFVVGSYWCCQFPKDDLWYRGRIMAVAPATDADQSNGMQDKNRKQKPRRSSLPRVQVHVHFVDYGDVTWIGTEHLRVLHKEFCKLPILAQKCRLANVQLPNETSLVTSTEPFRHFGDGKSIELEIVDTTPEYLSVLVRDPNGGVLNESTSTLRSSLMNGTTMTNGDGSTSSDDGLTSWNPMEQEYLSMRNSYNVDIDDAGVALTGYKAYDESEICIFYQRGQWCRRGNSCRYKHIKPCKDGTTTDTKPVPFEIPYIDLPELGALVAVKVTAILDPSQFWVTFPLMSYEPIDTLIDKDYELPADNLFELQEHMQSEYKGVVDRHGDNLLRMCGEMVAARYSVDGNWYRARVLDVDDVDATVTVSYVDYGNREVVADSEVRDLRSKFLHLPAQAVECCLSSLEPIDSDRWSDDANKLFVRLTDGQDAVARIVLIVDSKMFIELLGVTVSKQCCDISATLVKAKYARRTALAIT